MIHSVVQLKPKTVLEVLQRTDAFRRPERFQQILNVCQADMQGRLNLHERPYPQAAHWQNLLAAAQNIDIQAVLAEHRAQAAQIPHAIAQARLAQIRPIQKTFKALNHASEH